MSYQFPEQLTSSLSLIDERIQSALSSSLARAQQYSVVAWNRLPELVPYLPLIGTTAAALVCLMLFLSMRAQLKNMQVRLRSLEDRGTPEPASVEVIAPDATSEPDDQRLMLLAAPRSGLDTTIRSKVLRMHRAGQSSDDIAASLRMPRGEVDLLVKVHEIELGSLGEPASA